MYVTQGKHGEFHFGYNVATLRYLACMLHKHKENLVSKSPRKRRILTWVERHFLAYLSLKAMYHVHVFLSIFQYNIPDDSDIIDLADLSIVRDTGENSLGGGGEMLVA